MKTALALRHVHFEDLGTLEPLLQARGYQVRYLDPAVDALGADAAAADLLVVLGGPLGACDEALYPFLAAEQRLIAQRLAQGRPLLGICLGAQLMARALGARVAPMGSKEIGFGVLTLTEAGRDSVLGACRTLGVDSENVPQRDQFLLDSPPHSGTMGQEDGKKWAAAAHSQPTNPKSDRLLAPLAGVPVLHWHGDRFDLPAGAQLLASTAQCAQQAFARGPAVLGLQFHLEVDERSFERWLVGHCCELAQAGIDPRSLRADAQRCAPALAQAAQQVLGRWLDGVESCASGAVR